jgi:hypothetical protein
VLGFEIACFAALRRRTDLIWCADDFELANPIGPHKGIKKVTVIYFQLVNLPPAFRNKVEHIQVTHVHSLSTRTAPRLAF